jgi:dimethylamine/trimethylamine dehydrogenase
VLDLIGGARASIADPFLPSKIREGRSDEIRECIGCNICIASWHDGVPVRCTQNATAGEEWRRGWHPERHPPAASDDSLLVVGSGPAGLEAALIAARRGYRVTLVERASHFGGRVAFESRLPGLAAWGRVRDYRLHALRQMANVSLYADSELGADEVLELGCQRVAIATGARWTPELYSTMEVPYGELAAAEKGAEKGADVKKGTDLFLEKGTDLFSGNRKINPSPFPKINLSPFSHPSPFPGVYTPDDIAAGVVPEGPVLVFDHDNYYMGGVLAEYLAARGCAVHYATPAGTASAWTFMTNEQPFVYRALAAHNVGISTTVRLTAFDGERAVLANMHTGAESLVPAHSVLIVGMRLPNDALYQALLARKADWAAAGLVSVERIGDALAAGLIAHAVHSGHAFAEGLDRPGDGMYLRDLPICSDAPATAYASAEQPGDGAASGQGDA